MLHRKRMLAATIFPISFMADLPGTPDAATHPTMTGVKVRGAVITCGERCNDYAGEGQGLQMTNLSSRMRLLHVLTRN